MPTVIKTQTKILPVFVGKIIQPKDFQARVESFHTTYRPTGSASSDTS